MPNTQPTVSIIIPVHNGGEAFKKCLASVKTASPSSVEVIVVADGDTDGSWRVAEDVGAKVIRVSMQGGPAHTRNLGAQQAQGDILFFIDADVIIPEDIVAHVIEFFQDCPEIAAILGSYDDESFQPNFLSQDKNLMHHYVHQTGNEEASTFWAGCRAIRRKIFLEFDGFNDNYRHPCIEDIELGYRLKKAGNRIRLVKHLQVKHLKHWPPFSLLKADIFYRALFDPDCRASFAESGSVYGLLSKHFPGIGRISCIVEQHLLLDGLNRKYKRSGEGLLYERYNIEHLRA